MPYGILDIARSFRQQLLSDARIGPLGRAVAHLVILDIGLRHVPCRIGRRRRQERILASPLIEETAVGHVARRIVQRAEVAIHPLVAVGGRQRHLAVRHPDMPAPNDLARKIAQRDHRIALLTARREPDTAVAVNRFAVDHVAAARLVGIENRLPQQLGRHPFVEQQAVLVDVFRIAVAQAVALDRGVEDVRRTRRRHVAVGRTECRQVRGAGSVLHHADFARQRRVVDAGNRHHGRLRFRRQRLSGRYRQQVPLLPVRQPTCGVGRNLPLAAVGVDHHGSLPAVGRQGEDPRRGRQVELGLGGAVFIVRVATRQQHAGRKRCGIYPRFRQSDRPAPRLCGLRRGGKRTNDIRPFRQAECRAELARTLPWREKELDNELFHLAFH